MITIGIQSEKLSPTVTLPLGTTLILNGVQNFSVMHYAFNSAAVDITKPTLTPKVKPDFFMKVLGQREGISDRDAELLRKMYCMPGMLSDCSERALQKLVPKISEAKTNCNGEYSYLFDKIRISLGTVNGSSCALPPTLRPKQSDFFIQISSTHV